MTGVVKSVGKYALLAGTALALSISVASAASLTKAGMDKRVADLEREVTLLKNQMKSAMMAKPADKNIQSGQQPREGHDLRPGQPGGSRRVFTPTRTDDRKSSIIRRIQHSRFEPHGLPAAVNKNTSISGVDRNRDAGWKPRNRIRR